MSVSQSVSQHYWSAHSFHLQRAFKCQNLFFSPSLSSLSSNSRLLCNDHLCKTYEWLELKGFMYGRPLMLVLMAKLNFVSPFLANHRENPAVGKQENDLNHASHSTENGEYTKMSDFIFLTGHSDSRARGRNAEWMLVSDKKCWIVRLLGSVSNHIKVFILFNIPIQQVQRERETGLPGLPGWFLFVDHDLEIVIKSHFWSG